MAEITEVIHKITYEVNDAALQKAANAINAQLTELQKLNAELLSLQQQLSRTGEKEIAAINKLSSELDKVFNKISQTAGKTKGVLEQIGDGIVKGLGGGGI